MYTRHSVGSQQLGELRCEASDIRISMRDTRRVRLERGEHQERIPRASSRRARVGRIGAISSRPEFAFDYQRFPGHVGARLKDGIGNEDDSSALSADRVILWRSEYAFEAHFATPERCYEFL